jgi:hypothetical protein
VNYKVRRWHREGSKHKQVDQVVEAPTPEDAARSVAWENGDTVTRVWGPYLGLTPPVLFLVGCNSTDGKDNASIEVYEEEPQ